MVDWPTEAHGPGITAFRAPQTARVQQLTLVPQLTEMPVGSRGASNSNRTDQRFWANKEHFTGHAITARMRARSDSRKLSGDSLDCVEGGQGLGPVPSSDNRVRCDPGVSCLGRLLGDWLAGLAIDDDSVAQ